MIWVSLAASFSLIGATGFGGGYAMLSLIHAEVVTRHGWMETPEFTDMVAISQMTPGPIAVNAATFLGYTEALRNHPEASMVPGWLYGLAGASLATFAVLLPPFILMYAASVLFMRLRHHPRVKRAMADLRPVVIGLIAAAAWLILASPNTFRSDSTPHPQWLGNAIFAAALILSLQTKWHPGWMLLGAGAAGFFLAG